MMRENKRRMAQPAPDAEAGAAPQPKSMPRFGIAGTITRQQTALLKHNEFEPNRQWSKEEAQLVIDAVTYLRAAIRTVTGETGAPIEIQNSILGFILGDDDLRDDVLDWGLNRTHEEEDAGADVDLPDDETFERIAGHIRQLWDDV